MVAAFYAFLSNRCLLRFAFWTYNGKVLATVLAVVAEESRFLAGGTVYL
jgi:hypothetical protein